MCPGTRLANLPLPTTEDASTGSVAVTHAPIANASANDGNPGIKAYMIADETSQATVMTGTSRVEYRSPVLVHVGIR